ncbi:MAG: response regulator [Verrucomicrobiota bacterium]|nr:response regulator [Verrucomicrobiota bacterium]
MLAQEDLKWIATTSTELNTMLQQISRYTDLAQQHKGEYNYLEMLSERVELATKTTQNLFDRVTSSILSGKVAPSSVTSRAPFSVVPLPLAPAETPEQKQSKPSSARAANTGIPPEFKLRNPDGPLELILLVDDEVEIAELAAALLNAEGYRVILAKDGFEALKIYGQIGRQIGLVILDFFLPVMDGDAVFDELRALNSDVNVVLSSGFAEQTKLGSMLARGLRGFIPKPYTREKLLAQVSSTLEAARQAIA